MWVLGPGLPADPPPAGSFGLEGEGPVIPDPLPDEHRLTTSATKPRTTTHPVIAALPVQMLCRGNASVVSGVPVLSQPRRSGCR